MKLVLGFKPVENLKTTSPSLLSSQSGYGFPFSSLKRSFPENIADITPFLYSRIAPTFFSSNTIRSSPPLKKSAIFSCSFLDGNTTLKVLYSSAFMPGCPDLVDITFTQFLYLGCKVCRKIKYGFAYFIENFIKNPAK